MHSRANPGSPPIYSVEVVTISSRRSVIANCGLRITADRTSREVRGKIDTLLVAGGDAIEQNKIDPEAVRWLKRISGRIRRVGSVCTGAMLLARAGLLDGRRATTHWNWCQTLIKRAPRARVDADPIFVRDENVYTSAGVTAGMDLALALVEEDHGSRLALQVARNLVLYLRRPGGQSQFSAALSLQLTDRKPLRELEAWVLDNLQKPLTVPLLAATRRDESAQFRTRLHQRDEDHARKICRAPACRSSSPSIGRKSQQHGNDRRRMRLRERQLDAQRLSADPENRTWPIPSPLSSCETFGSEKIKSGTQERRRF